MLSNPKQFIEQTLHRQNLPHGILIKNLKVFDIQLNILNSFTMIIAYKNNILNLQPTYNLCKKFHNFEPNEIVILLVPNLNLNSFLTRSSTYQQSILWLKMSPQIQFDFHSKIQAIRYLGFQTLLIFYDLLSYSCLIIDWKVNTQKFQLNSFIRQVSKYLNLKEK